MYTIVQVFGATMDGSSVNRSLINLHKVGSEVVYKLHNPYANDDCQFYFLLWVKNFFPVV